MFASHITYLYIYWLLWLLLHSNMATVEEVLENVLAPNSRRAYNTYTKQYITYAIRIRKGHPIDSNYNDLVDLLADFFHTLKERGLSVRTIDQAKSSIVNFYKKHRVSPNPAQDDKAKDYVLGTMKMNRRSGIVMKIRHILLHSQSN